MVSNKVIPIFMSSDDNYAPYLCVSMYSILQNTESFIEFYILDGGIAAKNRAKLEKSLKKFQNKKIIFLDMKKFNLENFPDLRHYSVNTFSRYFIPKICPNLSKVIYLDVDTIITGDISALFEESLDNYPIAAVPESFHKLNGRYLKENIYLKYNNPDNYFNAGVLIIDVQKLAENNYSEILIEKTIEYADKLSCADQDIFNIVFESNYKKLNYKYNYIPDFDNLYKVIEPDCSLDENHLIIHFASNKPWKTFTVPFSDSFYLIAAKTLFSFQIQSRLLKEQIYHAFRIHRCFLFRNIKFFLMRLFFSKAERNK